VHCQAGGIFGGLSGTGDLFALLSGVQAPGDAPAGVDARPQPL